MLLFWHQSRPRACVWIFDRSTCEGRKWAIRGLVYFCRNMMSSFLVDVIDNWVKKVADCTKRTWEAVTELPVGRGEQGQVDLGDLVRASWSDRTTEYWSRKWQQSHVRRLGVKSWAKGRSLRVQQRPQLDIEGCFRLVEVMELMSGWYWLYGNLRLVSSTCLRRVRLISWSWSKQPGFSDRHVF